MHSNDLSWKRHESLLLEGCMSLRPSQFQPMHFQPVPIQPIPFQLFTLSTYCNFEPFQFRPFSFISKLLCFPKSQNVWDQTNHFASLKQYLHEIPKRFVQLLRLWFTKVTPRDSQDWLTRRRTSLKSSYFVSPSSGWTSIE